MLLIPGGPYPTGIRKAVQRHGITGQKGLMWAASGLRIGVRADISDQSDAKSGLGKLYREFSSI
jgi:hypothetical protein